MVTITFSRVAAALLELQRLTLATIQLGHPITQEQMDAITGVQEMLDDWSDERYFHSGEDLTNG
jgi:hypothetical protein